LDNVGNDERSIPTFAVPSLSALPVQRHIPRAAETRGTARTPDKGHAVVVSMNGHVAGHGNLLTIDLACNSPIARPL
jgi:hypothetical protein